MRLHKSTCIIKACQRWLGGPVGQVWGFRTPGGHASSNAAVAVLLSGLGRLGGLAQTGYAVFRGRDGIWWRVFCRTNRKTLRFQRKVQSYIKYLIFDKSGKTSQLKIKTLEVSLHEGWSACVRGWSHIKKKVQVRLWLPLLASLMKCMLWQLTSLLFVFAYFTKHTKKILIEQNS